MTFRICSSILLLGILVCIHLTPQPLVLTVQTTPYKGISPVDNSILPLTTDDLARGLLFNPTIVVPYDQIKQTYRYRTEFAQLQDKHRILQIQLSSKAVALLKEMESK